MIRKVYMEIRKTDDGKLWGLIGNMDKENDSRFITEEYDKYHDVIREGKLRAIQLGWDLVECRDISDKENNA